MKGNNPKLTLNDISNLRLSNQKVIINDFKSVKETVAWMGAMQAQDFNSAKWAVGVRLWNTSEDFIEKAFNNGEILRTHLLRPTWHLVSQDDIVWMLELTGPKIKTAVRARDRNLGLSEDDFIKTNTIIEKSLSGGNHLTREELIAFIEKAGIDVSNYRDSHILMRAELDGIICSGSLKEGKQTYALIQERVTNPKIFTREEALAELTKRYFKSHGPATLQDFVWWSGLTVGYAKLGLESVKSDFIIEKIGEQNYIFPSDNINHKSNGDLVYLLPAFDEFIISYRDRTPSLPFENQIKAVSNNGVFRPVIVYKGQVIGIWKRTMKKNKVVIVPDFFDAKYYSLKELIVDSSIHYSRFLNQDVEVVI